MAGNTALSPEPSEIVVACLQVINRVARQSARLGSTLAKFASVLLHVEASAGFCLAQNSQPWGDPFGILRGSTTAHARSNPSIHCYNNSMQRKVFWITFAVGGLIADVALPLWWALAATVPIGVASWWIAYRSEWF